MSATGAVVKKRAFLKRWAPAALGSVLFVAMPAPSAAGSIQTATYVGGSGQPVSVCSDTPQNVGLNSACFRLSGVAGQVGITLSDAAGPGVGARYRVAGPTGQIGSGTFCGSTSFAVTSAAERLTIYVNGPQISGCTFGRSGTFGTIRATLP